MTAGDWGRSTTAGRRSARKSPPVSRGRRHGDGKVRSTRKTQAGEQQLLLRGKRLPRGRGKRLSCVVFDDVTHVLQAQRDAAWAEVARRLAHEIKNPLTPIQLSAERLQLKLAAKLDAADAGMLDRSTQTIVNQVAALKRMVDAFSQYARAPEPAMRELDLNALVREVLTLYESLGSSIRLELARRVAAHRGRRGAVAPGDPQSVAERAGCARR